MIILVPVIFVANLVWSNYNVNKMLEGELQKKAVLMADAFSSSITDHLSQPGQLTEEIQALLSSEPLIKEITIYQYTNNSFVTTASSNPDLNLVVLNDPTSVSAWSENKSVANQETYSGTNEKVWSVITPLKDKNGNKVALLSTKLSVQDITDLEKSNYQQSLIFLIASVILIFILLINHLHFIWYAKLFSAVKEVNKLKDEFVVNATNNLQMPIITIKNYTATLSKTYYDRMDEVGKKCLDGISVQISSLIIMAKDLLNLSRIEHGEMPVNKQDVNPATICQNVYEQLSAQSTIKKNNITYTPPDSQVITSVDAEKFKQAIISIVNIVQQKSGDSIINIFHEYVDNGDSWSVSIKSSAFVLNNELDFEKTEDNSSVPQFNSVIISDLGLSFWITQQVINRMGGRISIEPIAPQGAVFRIIFPIKDTVNQTKISPAASHSSS